MLDAGVTVPMLGKELGITYQAVKKVVDGKTGSFTAQNNARAATMLRVSSDWLASGRGQKNAYPARKGVDRSMSDMQLKLAPRYVEWEQLMRRPIEPEFQTVVPDASMAPEVPSGARVIFVTGVDPVPGDFVLISDSTGGVYLREFKQLRPGRWEAHARNQAFLPLDSERDGLQVLAVFDGIRGGRGAT